MVVPSSADEYEAGIVAELHVGPDWTSIHMLGHLAKGVSDPDMLHDFLSQDLSFGKWRGSWDIPKYGSYPGYR